MIMSANKGFCTIGDKQFVSVTDLLAAVLHVIQSNCAGGYAPAFQVNHQP